MISQFKGGDQLKTDQHRSCRELTLKLFCGELKIFFFTKILCQGRFGEVSSVTIKISYVMKVLKNIRLPLFCSLFGISYQRKKFCLIQKCQFFRIRIMFSEL